MRGVWFLADESYPLATHAGNQVWYVDTGGIIHLFINGTRDVRTEDGKPHDTPGYKISEPRAVYVDPEGNVIITENDGGYIRMVERAIAYFVSISEVGF